LTEALLVEQNDPERALVHRTRLATVLRLCPRLVQVVFQDEAVGRADFTPDGKRLLLSIGSNRAGVWDVATGKPVSPPLVLARECWQTHFSPDGRLVVAVEGNQAQTWDVASGKAQTAPMEHSKEVRVVTFRPDGRAVLSATGDYRGRNEIRIWDPTTGNLLFPILQIPEAINQVVFSPDGERLAIALGTEARIWDLGKGKFLDPPLGHEGSVTCLAFSPDGRRIATGGGGDETIRVWDATTGEPITPPMRQASSVSFVTFSPDGRRLTAGGLGRMIWVWDAATGQPVTPPLQHAEAVAHAAFSPDGRHIVTASADGTARVWDAATGEPVTPSLRHGDQVSFAAFSPDGRQVVTASMDRTAKVWDLATGQPGFLPTPVASSGATAWLSPDGSRLLTLREESTVQTWDTATGKACCAPRCFLQPVQRLVLSGNGQQFLTISQADGVRLWKTETLEPVGPPVRPKGLLVDARLGPDDRHVVTINQDQKTQVQTIRVWDGISGQAVTSPLEHPCPPYGAWLSPDARFVLVAGLKEKEHRVRIWEVSTGRLVSDLANVEGKVLEVGFAAGGFRLVSTRDREVRVWDSSTGKPLTPPLIHAANPLFAGWNPTSERLVTVASDGTSRIWDAATGQPTIPPRKHGRGSSATFSPDGRFLLTSGDETARLWDTATGQAVSPALPYVGTDPLMIFADAGRRLLTLNDGSRVVTAGDEWDSRMGKEIRVWDLAPDDRSVEDLLLAARMLSGRRIDDKGGNVPFSATEADWHTFAKRCPDLTAPTADQVVSWMQAEARTCERERNWSAALPLLDRLIAARPDDATLHFRRGNGLAMLGKFGPAAEDFARSLALEGRDPVAWRSRAEALALVGRHEEAEAAFTRVLELNEMDVDAWYERGAARARGNRFAEAAEDFGRAAELAPQELRHNSSRAATYLLMGDKARYGQLCRDALDRLTKEATSSDVNTVVWLCALAPDAVSDWTAVLRRAEQMVADVPNDANLKDTLGALLFRAGKYAEAVRVLEATVRADKEDAMTTTPLFLAMAYQRLNRPEDARGWLDEARRRWEERPAREKADWYTAAEWSLLYGEAVSLIRPGAKP
jgi:WD40 repeat protein/tetratricopeptide (TPR) repeat protein